MRKLAILTFQSIDGVMQAPSSPDEDRSRNFSAGGWANPWWAEVMEDVREVAMREPYDLLLGRKTYEMFASHWATQPNTSREASIMNKAAKYVVTQGELSPVWVNSTVLNGNAVEKVQELKAGKGPLLQVHGSWRLIQMLHQERLIDEYRIWSMPTVVGHGKRLFEVADRPVNLQPISQRCFSSGIVRSVLQAKSD